MSETTHESAREAMSLEVDPDSNALYFTANRVAYRSWSEAFARLAAVPVGSQGGTTRETEELAMALSRHLVPTSEVIHVSSPSMRR